MLANEWDKPAGRLESAHPDRKSANTTLRDQGAKSRRPIWFADITRQELADCGDESNIRQDEVRISRHDQALAADACKTRAELPADLATLRNRPTELEWVERCKR